jgi:hypothetical protein
MLWMRVVRHLLGWAVWYAWARSLLWVRAFFPPFLPRDLPSPLRMSYAEGVELMAIGFVGGIESISIDGKRWFFGFHFSSDTVISPLIDDPDMMAAFASRYMLQMDGVHGRRYWRALVNWAIDESELCGEDGGRTFTNAGFRRIAAELAAAQAGNHAIPDFTIEYHLLYLLEAAARTSDEAPRDDPAYVFAIRKLGISEDETTMGHTLQAGEMLSGSRPLLGSATYADAAAAVRACLATLVNRGPGNWRTLFRPLVEG